MIEERKGDSGIEGVPTADVREILQEFNLLSGVDTECQAAAAATERPQEMTMSMAPGPSHGSRQPQAKELTAAAVGVDAELDAVFEQLRSSLLVNEGKAAHTETLKGSDQLGQELKAYIVLLIFKMNQERMMKPGQPTDNTQNDAKMLE